MFQTFRYCAVQAISRKGFFLRRLCVCASIGLVLEFACRFCRFFCFLDQKISEHVISSELAPSTNILECSRALLEFYQNWRSQRSFWRVLSDLNASAVRPSHLHGSVRLVE
jgi:hypothetical protein